MLMRVVADRYALVRLVGRGGMGEVWEAHDRVIARRVAVKLMTHDRRAAPAAAELFLREARTAGALNHPGVVTMHDAGQDPVDGTLFLVMEYVDGQDLATVLREDGPPPVPNAVDWAAQILSALARAHDAGVVHRDLKPANLMLTAEGRIKILDFGIARFVQAATVASAVMGTLAYMAPERFDAQPGDARSDLYSFGCVLHELLTGQVPFDTTGPVSAMQAHLNRYPAPPSLRRPGVPSALDDLVVSLLAKTPDARPGSAHEVLGSLSAHSAATRTVRSTLKPPSSPTGPMGSSTADRPFEASWTGGKGEPAGQFSQYAGSGRGLLLTLAIIMVAVLVTKPVWLWAITCGGIELALVLIWWGGRRKAIRRLQGKLCSRTVRVGSEGISAEDPTRTVALRWSSIAEVGLFYTDAEAGTCHLLALHVRLHHPESEHAVVQSVVRSGPIGWPQPWDDYDRFDNRDDWLPVCVFGPLPDHRQAHMRNAVTAFAKRPLEIDESG
ncbi:serine/threonine-protein kinase [Embleya sp. AB8]|uniref:serine/threonine-protein kinase n=1 Tax=Embleya sp. AB8 TaxID=3156304 RepID=UPI003C737122